MRNLFFLGLRRVVFRDVCYRVFCCILFEGVVGEIVGRCVLLELSVGEVICVFGVGFLGIVWFYEFIDVC